MLVEPLGRGGQGSVWRAIDPLNRAEVALKLFNLSTLSDTAAERARREARAVASLAHPSIVRCHALFELPADGQIGLVFDLVHGVSLASAMHDERMTVDHRHAVLVHLAVALQHVHRYRTVHRDIKPDNLLVTNTFWEAPLTPGNVKLVDFGIASRVDAGPEVGSGGVVGTRPYLSPESLMPNRFPFSRDSFTPDIFAFGVLAWELLIGGHPTGLPLSAPLEMYRAAYKAAAERRSSWPRTSPPISASRLINACLAIDPARRPADGTQLVEALRASRAPGEMRDSRWNAVLAAPTESRYPTADFGDDRPALHGSPNPITATPLPSVIVSAPREAPRHVASNRTPMSNAGPPSVSSPSAAVTHSPVPSARAPISGPVPAPPPLGRRRWTMPWVAIPLASMALSVGIYFALASKSGASAPSSGAAAGSLLDPPAEDLIFPSPIPCCTDAATCRSGRLCRAEPCRTVIPERRWRLRVTGVAMRPTWAFEKAEGYPEDLSKTHPNSRVCFRRTVPGADWICVPLADAARTSAGDVVHRPEVYTSDLKASRLEILVQDGDGTTLAHGMSAPNPEGFKLSTLCDGVKLYVGSRDTALALVYAYLDDG